MRYDRRTLTGLLVLVGAVEFLLGMLVAEGMRPSYSVSSDAISGLGVDVSAPVFNGSIIVLGVLTLAAAYLYHATHRRLWVTIPFLLAGVGPIGVGLFPETIPAPHGVFAFVSFVFGGLTAILTSFQTRPPFRYLALVLGILGLVSLVLFVSGAYLGIGLGGMERMIVYPVLFWAIAFGGYLMATPEAAVEPAPAGSG